LATASPASWPFGKGKHWLNAGPVAQILGGWQINGALTLMTGTPFDIRYSATGLNAPGNTQTANQIAPMQILHGINTGNQWFSTASYAAPATGVFGNVGRNVFSGPGLFGLSASLFKSIQINERVKMEVRCESFGITNTPQFSNPGNTLGNASFGYVTGTVGSGSGVNGTGGGRAFQLGAKVSF